MLSPERLSRGGSAASMDSPPGKDEYIVQEKPEKKTNPFLAFIILWTTQTPEDVGQPQPLNKRIYKLISLCRRNIAMILSQSLKKGVTPLLAQNAVRLLQAAHVAMLAGGAAAITAKVVFYKFIFIYCLCLAGIRVLDEFVKVMLKQEQITPRIVTAKETIYNFYKGTSSAMKTDAYSQARNLDNNSAKLSELGERYSNLTRKTISFFVDFAIFSMLIGPYVLFAALSMTVLITSISARIARSDAPNRKALSQKESDAQKLEHSAELRVYDEESMKASRDLSKLSLTLYIVKRCTEGLKSLSGDLSYPLAMLYFSICVLNGNMNPAVALICTDTFKKVFRELLDYPEIFLGRQKFATTLNFQLRAVDEIDPDFIARHYNELNKPYFPVSSKLNILIHIWIYAVAFIVIAGLILIPTPAITPIITAFISQYTHKQLAFSFASGWLASSAFFAILNGSKYKPEDTTSFYMVLGLFVLLTAGSVYYTPLLFAAYAHEAWTTTSYLIATFALCSTVLFDALLFQNFAYAIDAITIYLSQEIVLFLQTPQFVYEISRDFVYSKSLDGAEYMSSGLKSMLSRCDSLIAKAREHEHHAAAPLV